MVSPQIQIGEFPWDVLSAVDSVSQTLHRWSGPCTTARGFGGKEHAFPVLDVNSVFLAWKSESYLNRQLYSLRLGSDKYLKCSHLRGKCLSVCAGEVGWQLALHSVRLGPVMLAKGPPGFCPKQKELEGVGSHRKIIAIFCFSLTLSAHCFIKMK